MTKFIKTLAVINGLLLPLIILSFMIYQLADWIKNSSHRHVAPPGVKTENTIVEKEDTLIIQGLSYAAPVAVYNSTNFIIEIKPKTFDEPQKVQTSKSMNFRAPNSNYALNDFNVLFLDKDYKVIGRLLDKKGSIKSLEIPYGSDQYKVDTSVKNIAYEIAFNDDTEDGIIDDDDLHDLYLSNLSGKELTQVTNGVDVDAFEFINNHSALMITYTDRSDLTEEYKIKKFAIYTIATKQLCKLTEVDKGIEEIQKILNRTN